MSASTHVRQNGMAPPEEQRVSPLPDVIGLGGAIAGIGGGIAMAIVGWLIALATGTDVWLTPKLIAVAAGGPEVVRPGFELGPVFAGTIMHLIASAVLGAIFGIVTRRIMRLPSGFGIPLVSGFIYALAVWFVAYFMVLPFMNPALLTIYAPAFLIQNLTFGVVMGMIYAYLRP
jgi:hypothetical protein